MHALGHTSSVLDDVISTANHSPELADQVMLVGTLERILGWIEARRTGTPGQEHTQAAGGLQTALQAERRLLTAMARRTEGRNALR